MPSREEREAVIRERVERLAKIGAQADLLPHRLLHLETELFENFVLDGVGYEERWLTKCEGLLTEEAVAEVERQVARARLMAGNQPPPQNPMPSVPVI